MKSPSKNLRMRSNLGRFIKKGQAEAEAAVHAAYREAALSFERDHAKPSPMSEQRIANLEARVSGVEGRLDRMEGKLDRIGETLADIRVELASKPSTGTLWTMVGTMLAVAIAMAGISFLVADWVRAGL